MKMSQSYTLEEIMERICKKMRGLETVTIFVKSKQVLKEELLKMRTAVSEMCKNIDTMRAALEDMRKQNNQARDLLLLITELDEKIIHMEENVPPQLINDYVKNFENALTLSVNEDGESLAMKNGEEETQNTTIRDCKKTLFKEPEVYPTILSINSDEFAKIPKYIIGRQSLDIVNSFIDTINQILKAKYTFLWLGKAHARKQGDLNLYLHYKKQDLDICTDHDYVYFFTGEDYERHTHTKLNKAKLNLLIVLRHCKRLREHRIKNSLRYVILTTK